MRCAVLQDLCCNGGAVLLYCAVLWVWCCAALCSVHHKHFGTKLSVQVVQSSYHIQSTVQCLLAAECCAVRQAARAYDAAAIVIRGPTARTNFTYPLQLLHIKPKRGRVRMPAFILAGIHLHYAQLPLQVSQVNALGAG